jgi:hypothetical protein
MSKRSGRKSQGANDFLMPYAPTINSVSDAGTARPYNDGAIDVSFTADPRNAATSYTVLSTPGNYTASGSSSPIRVTGLSSDTAYTFTVTATNAYGTSAASSTSGSVTATTVPATPSAPSATAQGGAANDDVSWSAPATGGKAITSYTWASSDGKGATQAGTSVAVAQEAGTAQTYTVYATNDNGNSGTSSASGSVTSFSFTPFSFAPFGAFGFTPFGFTPFGAFGFTPFGAFGFTPFGFTPFGAFGFTPFGAFGFTPFGAFSFAPFGFSPPRCIEENTLVDTPNGLVAAKDLQIGDTVYTVSLQEVPLSDETGQYDFDYVGFESDTLTSLEKTTTVITGIDPSTRDMAICFNNEQEKLFSTSQPIFAKTNNKYVVMPTGALSAGDYLVSVNNDGSLTEVLVETIDAVTKDTNVYQFNCEPADWFIAGGYLVHNK